VVLLPLLEDGHSLLSPPPDYPRLCLAWLQCGKEHAGPVISDRLPIGETVRRLLKLLNWVTADEMRNEIRWLQPHLGEPSDRATLVWDSAGMMQTSCV